MKVVIKIVLFVLTVVFFEVNAEVYSSNTLIDAKLVEVNYYEAVVDIEFYLEDEKNLPSLSVEADSLNSTKYNVVIQRGFNKIKVPIKRPYIIGKESHVTKKLTLHASELTSYPFWSEEVDFEINWPSTDFISEVLGDSKADYFDYSSIYSINISRHAHESENIYKDILMSGAPIHKVKRLGGMGEVHDSSILKVKFGWDVEPAAAQNILSFLLKNNHKVVFAEYGVLNAVNDKSHDVFITPAFRDKFSKVAIEKIKKNNLSDVEFLTLLGAKKPSLDDYIERQYKFAYRLIDNGNNRNLKEAKNILDDIISKDPEYVNAYVELARCKIKIAQQTPESYKSAEKILLIAKDIDPEHADTRVLLGYVYTGQERFKEAELEYQHAKKIGTENSWLYANWGLNDEAQSNIDEAIIHYLKVMDEPRRFARNDRVMKWTKDHLFPLMEKSKRYEEADKHYTQYIKNFPSSSKCLYLDQAENNLFNLGDYESAIKKNIMAANSGCQKKSASLAVAYFLKWYAADTGNSTKDSVYRQAEAMAPSDATLFFNLARSELTAPIINILIENGRELSSEDSEGLNALLMAVYVGNVEVAKRLFILGSDVNGMSEKIKITALGLAVMKSDKEMVQLLVDNKADAAMPMLNGVSIYEWAKTNSVIEVSQLLNDKQSI